jgi:hypothetical protein
MTKYPGLCAFSLFALGGCATIISGETDRVTFTAIPDNTTFNIKDETGKSVHHGTTLATVLLDRGNGYFDGQTYQIDFSAPGYIPKTQELDTSLNGWYFGNLIFGGVLGLLVIDPATGSMWDLPEKLDVTLSLEKHLPVNK